MKYFKAKKIFTGKEIIQDQYLKVENGKFISIHDQGPNDKSKIINAHWIAPGLVDTHIHGLKNFDVMDNSEYALDQISKHLPECGVTSFLATTLTASSDQINEVCKTIANYKQKEGHAKIQGIFLEGPFFTEKYKGAQNPKYFKDPDLKLFKKWQESARGLIRKIAIAPERKGSFTFIKELNKQGVKTCIAHSDATFDQSLKAVKKGASIFVHTFNAMSSLHHREPGIVGAALLCRKLIDKDFYAELICDGHHVHKAAAQILVDAVKSKRIVLVSDCMRAGLMPDGEYNLGEFKVMLSNQSARISSGALAGSVLKLIDGVKNIYKWKIADISKAINMASFNSAKSVEIHEKCGLIKANLDADFIVLSQKAELLQTYIKGQLVYSKK